MKATVTYSGNRTYKTAEGGFGAGARQGLVTSGLNLRGHQLKLLLSITIFFLLNINGVKGQKKLEPNNDLHITYIKEQNLLKVNLFSHKRFSVDSELWYGVKKMGNISGSYFVISIENLDGIELDSDTYCIHKSPLETSQLQDKNNRSLCEINVFPNQENIFYFEIVNNDNKFKFMDENNNGNECFSFYHFKRNKTYKLKLMLYDNDSLRTISNSIEFVY